MENVSMLRSETHRFFLEVGEEEKISQLNVAVKNTKIHMLDKQFVFSGASGLGMPVKKSPI